MRVYIDGYFKNSSLVSDKIVSKDEMILIYNKHIKEKERDVFVKTLCENFEFVIDSEMQTGEYDLIVDTDTDIIYQPKY